MTLIFLVLGFIALIVLVYLFYNLSTAATPFNANFNRNGVSLTLVRQSFTGLGWIGVVLIFLSPLAIAFIASANLRAIARATFFDTPIPDFTPLYLALGFLGLIGFVFIIIGREFYVITPVRDAAPAFLEKPKPYSAPQPASDFAPKPTPPRQAPDAEPVPRPQFVTTMKDDGVPPTKL
ncbi:hypothetical protein [uncultured Bartonella sp.]|uniref:hypothetical protein n=1 Tax=uncultured Bartonella sp. TaxID=104108 RepID=UPI002635FDFE|nr:hypothetical protein [uncultured Bartonella sp.]